MRVVNKSGPRSSRWPSLALVVVLLAALAGAAGLFQYDRLREVYHQPRRHLWEVPRAYLDARLKAPAAPVLDIDLAYRDYERLAARRAEALEFGLLIGREDDWVSATIRHGEDTLPVKLRLKGDLVDHLTGDKWSFRARARADEGLFGMRRFSLQHPATRNDLAEWAYHTDLQRAGLLTPSYRFVRVRVNGDDKGIYALEEHMGKELLERQGRREGPILKFDESAFWDQRATALREGAPWASMDQINFRSAEITWFQEGRTARDSALAGLAASARAKLDAFRSGERTASDVFDVPSTAAFLARSKVWGAAHALLFFNLRWYVNPVTTLLEPIAYDAAPWSWNHDHMWKTRLFGSNDPRWTDGNEHDLWLHLLLSDEAMLRAYARELHAVVQPAYPDSFDAAAGKALRENLALLRTEWPETPDPRDAFARGRAFVAGVLNPAQALVVKRSRGRLLAANAAEVPVEVASTHSREAALTWENARLLRERAPETPLIWRELSKAAPADSFVVTYRVLGSTQTRHVPVSAASTEPAADALPMPSAPGRPLPSFLSPRSGEHAYQVASGTWAVNSDLTLPAGAALHAGPGTELRFAPGVVLMVSGRVELLGSESAPVVLRAGEGTWSGLVVSQAGDRSRLRHVRVLDTASIQRPGWTLPGGVTFYRSDVELSDCEFVGSRGEDALNVMNASLNMVRCLFRDTQSDAFDGDFVEGSLVDCSFVDVGGDAVDVSGSRVTVTRLRARRVADKAVSVGEDSEARVTDPVMESGGMGIAAKDLSRVTITGGTGQDLRLGLAAYTKKPVYGPARIVAEGFTLSGVTEPVLVQRGSLVEWNGVRYPGVDVDVEALYEAKVLGN